MKRKMIFMLSSLLVLASCSTNSSKNSVNSIDNPTAELAFNTLKNLNQSSSQQYNSSFITTYDAIELGGAVTEDSKKEFMNLIESAHKSIIESGKESGIRWEQIEYYDFVDYKEVATKEGEKASVYEGKLQIKHNAIIYAINVTSLNTKNGIKLIELNWVGPLKKLYEDSEKAQNENDMIKSLPFDVKVSGNLGKYYEVAGDTIVLAEQQYSDNKEYVLVVHLKRKNIPFNFKPEACIYAGNAVSLNKECDICEYKEFYLHAYVLDSDGLEIINSGATKGVEDLLTRGGEFGNIKKILFPLSIYDTQNDANDIVKKMSHVYLEGAHN